MSLTGKTILITGGARRIGRSLILALARAGADVVLHYWKSAPEAGQLQVEVERLGRRAFLLEADLSDPDQSMDLIARATRQTELFGLVNNAAVFEPLTWDITSLADWNRNLSINLSAPFLLSQAFANAIGPEAEGRIVNMLDWRALRPDAEHLPYSISKAGLAALTRSLAIALAPRISVNGLALGAVLPAQKGSTVGLLDKVPARRWTSLEEVDQALLFLLDGPATITGEILHLDGGRHLV
jgi:NAD(P)-dependent dehydrogenase (short-subunit alcohol dehydrogenase family)